MRSGRYLAMAAAMLTAAPAMAVPVTTPAPVAASTNPAASLSLEPSLRAGAKTQHDSQFTFLLGFIIFVVVGVGIAGAAGGFSSSK